MTTREELNFKSEGKHEDCKAEGEGNKQPCIDNVKALHDECKRLSEKAIAYANERQTDIDQKNATIAANEQQMAELRAQIDQLRQEKENLEQQVENQRGQLDVYANSIEEQKNHYEREAQLQREVIREQEERVQAALNSEHLEKNILSSMAVCYIDPVKRAKAIAKLHEFDRFLDEQKEEAKAEEQPQMRPSIDNFGFMNSVPNFAEEENKSREDEKLLIDMEKIMYPVIHVPERYDEKNKDKQCKPVRLILDSIIDVKMTELIVIYEMIRKYDGEKTQDANFKRQVIGQWMRRQIGQFPALDQNQMHSRDLMFQLFKLKHRLNDHYQKKREFELGFSVSPDSKNPQIDTKEVVEKIMRYIKHREVFIEKQKKKKEQYKQEDEMKELEAMLKKQEALVEDDYEYDSEGGDKKEGPV